MAGVCGCVCVQREPGPGSVGSLHAGLDHGNAGRGGVEERGEGPGEKKDEGMGGGGERGEGRGGGKTWRADPARILTSHSSKARNPDDSWP